MHSQLNLALAAARHQDLLEQGMAHRRAGLLGRRRRRDAQAPAIHWQGLTLRLATGADRASLTRLAELEQAARPAEPVLLGEVMERPVAALSLRDGSLVADPFVPTAELVELMRVRARQLSGA